MYKVSLIEERNILVTRKRKVWWSPKTTQTVRRAVVQMMDKKSTITFEIILNWKLDKVIGWYCSILFDPENFKSNKIQIYPWQEPILSEKLFTFYQHLFEFSGHELHFIIYGSSKTIFRAIILKHLHFKSFRGALLFFYVLKMDFMNSKDTNNSSQARVFRFLASSIVVAFGSTPWEIYLKFLGLSNI